MINNDQDPIASTHRVQVCCLVIDKYGAKQENMTPYYLFFTFRGHTTPQPA